MRLLDPDDTIAAIATPLAPGARGIVRLSGPRAWEIALERFDARTPLDPASVRHPTRFEGRLRLSALRRPVAGQLCLWPAPRTYTGQPLAELHLPGALPVVQALLADCLHAQARLAQPGEFTLRAFLAGRIDLTQAEAVAAVADATRPDQLQAALDQLAGGLARPIGALREQLLDLAAHLEATLDFVEEPDVDALGRDRLTQNLNEAAAWLASLAQRFANRDRPERPPRVVLVGAPNVGKSRLFNRLARSSSALVSEQAGTTRDYLASPCDCGSRTVELIDTAGADETGDPISQHAHQARSDQVAAADLLLLCQTSGIALPEIPNPGVPTLRVWTQADRSPPVEPGFLATSAQTGQGIDELRLAIADHLLASENENANAADQVVALTGARCQESLAGASHALASAAQGLAQHMPEDLVSLDLRLAIEALGSVLGLQITDDILDRIFQKFCIGK